MTDMTKQTEADRLANQLDYHREYDLGVTHTGIDEQAAAELRRQQAEIERLNEALAQQPAPATELREQEPVSDRENAIIRFALHQFMSNAYSHMNAAAQDKDSRYYTVSAVEKFAKDAKDAEALLSRLQFKAPQPAQRTWVSLTDEQWQSIADTLGCIITRSQKDAIEAIIGIYAPTELKEKNT